MASEDFGGGAETGQVLGILDSLLPVTAGDAVEASLFGTPNRPGGIGATAWRCVVAGEETDGGAAGRCAVRTREAS